MASWDELPTDQWEDMVATMLDDPYSNNFVPFNDANSGFTRDDLEAAANNFTDAVLNPANINNSPFDFAIYSPDHLGSSLQPRQYISDLTTMIPGAGKIPTIPYRREQRSTENPEPSNPVLPALDSDVVWRIDDSGGNPFQEWVFERGMNGNPDAQFPRTAEQFWQHELSKGCNQNIGNANMLRVGSSNLSNLTVLQNGYHGRAEQDLFDQFSRSYLPNFGAMNIQATMTYHSQASTTPTNKKQILKKLAPSPAINGQSSQTLPKTVSKKKMASRDIEAVSIPTQFGALRKLLPYKKRAYEDLMFSSSINDLAGMPAASKKIKTSKSRSCTFCSLKGRGCTRDEGHLRCRRCEGHYSGLPVHLWPNPPNMEKIALLVTRELLMHVIELERYDTFRIGYYLEQNIFFFMEPFSLDHTAPHKAFNNRLPIAWQKHIVELNDGTMQPTSRLKKSSMQSFITQFTVKWLPNKLRSINNGTVANALHIISCFCILITREKNKILQGRNITATEGTCNSQIFLLSVLLELEDLLIDLDVKIRNTGADPQQAQKNTCAIWILRRFIKSKLKCFRDSRGSASAILDDKNLTDFGRAMYDFETHLYERMESIQSALTGFKDKYGAYFCHTAELDQRPRHLDLFALQSTLDPLVNAAISELRPIEVELLCIDSEMLGLGSFTEVLGSGGPAVVECLQASALDPIVSNATSTSMPSDPLTKEALDTLQLKLAQQESPSDSGSEEEFPASSYHAYGERSIFGEAATDLPSLTSGATTTYVSLDALLDDLSMSPHTSKAKTPPRWFPDHCALWENGIELDEKDGVWRRNADRKIFGSWECMLIILEGPSDSYLKEERWMTWKSADFGADADGLLE